jgi:hypothetical protein
LYKKIILPFVAFSCGVFEPDKEEFSQKMSPTKVPNSPQQGNGNDGGPTSTTQLKQIHAVDEKDVMLKTVDDISGIQ